MEKIKVLFVPGGSGMAVAGIKCLKNHPGIEVLAADANELAPGLYLADRGFLVPPFGDLFWDTIRKLVKNEKISIIFPALDTILLDFSLRKKEFEEIGAEVVISPPDTIKITRDKWKTYTSLLKNKDINLPYSVKKIKDFKGQFPVIVKPRGGSGSKNVFIARNTDELKFFYNYVESPIIQEFLPGNEYTVDCLAGKNGELLLAIPRIRIETKAGISVKGKYVNNPELLNQIKNIIKVLSFYGPFVVQFKENQSGIPMLTEINPRIAGGMSYACYGGVNIYHLAIRLTFGESINISNIKKKIKYINYFFSRYFEDIVINSSAINKLRRL